MDIENSPYNSIDWVRDTLTQQLAVDIPSSELSNDLLRNVIIGSMTGIGQHVSDANKLEHLVTQGFSNLVSRITAPVYQGTSAATFQDAAVKLSVEKRAATALHAYTQYSWFNAWLEKSVTLRLGEKKNIFGLRTMLDNLSRYQIHYPIIPDRLFKRIYADWEIERDAQLKRSVDQREGHQPWSTLILLCNKHFPILNAVDLAYLQDNAHYILEHHYSDDGVNSRIVHALHAILPQGLGSDVDVAFVSNLYLEFTSLQRKTYMARPIEDAMFAAFVLACSIAHPDVLLERGADETWRQLQPYLPMFREHIVLEHCLKALPFTSHPWAAHAKELFADFYSWVCVRKELFPIDRTSPFFEEDVFHRYQDWIQSVDYIVENNPSQMKVGELCTRSIYTCERKKAATFLESLDRLHRQETCDAVPLDIPQMTM